MTYNPCFYQLREGQLQRMLEIISHNKEAKPHGVVFFGDSLTQMYDLEKYFPQIPLNIIVELVSYIRGIVMDC